MATFTSNGIDPEIQQRVLEFLNTASVDFDIAGIEPQEGPVFDDPTKGYSAQPKGYDIGLTVAQRILDKRATLGDAGFTDLSQLSDIRGLGQDKFDDLIYTFSHSSPPTLPSLINCGEPATPSIITTSPLWTQSSNLTPPALTLVRATDNAIILQWEDDNTTADGYRVYLGGTGVLATYFNLPGENRTAWFTSKMVFVPDSLPRGIGSTGQGRVSAMPLISESTHEVTIWATDPNGVSESGPNSSAHVTLSAPSIQVGDPATGRTITPPTVQPFAVWDANGNGIVDSEPSGGVFPRYPGCICSRTTTRRGNAFDAVAGVRANAVVGYFFYDDNTPQFVAYHLFVDSSNNVAPISVHYGDAEEGVAGNRVWVSPPGTIVQNTQVTSGVASINIPNIIEGTVTAGTMASDGSNRIVEFQYSLALVPQ